MVYTVTRNVNISSTGDGKSVWRQFLLAFLSSIPFFTQAVETKSLTTSAHTGHFISTPDDVPWSTTALVIAAGASAPVYGYLIDKFGRRCGIYLVSLLQGASCIPLFLSPSEANQIILHVFSGAALGGLFTVHPIYIREISDDDIRGLTVSQMMVMTTAGYMMNLIMAKEEMMYLMIALVAVQLIMSFLILESPSYLVMVGKIEAAKTNIAKLYNFPEDSIGLSNELAVLENEKERARSNGKLNVITILKNPIYRDATKLGLVLHTTIVLSGSILFLDQEKTLVQLKMPVDPQRTLVICCLFGGALFTVALIKFVERKYLLTLGYVIMVLSMGVLAVFTQNDLTISSSRWAPEVCLGLVVFGYGVAWALPIIIMGEVYNFEIRATMLGILFTYSQIIKLAHLHSFKYIEDYMGTYTVLYVIVGINMYGGVYALFAVPMLKNKTTRQIERQLKRVPILQFNK